MPARSGRRSCPDDHRGRRHFGRPAAAKPRLAHAGLRQPACPLRLFAPVLRLPDTADRGRDRVLVQPPGRPLQLHVAGLHVRQLARLERGSGTHRCLQAVARDRPDRERACDRARNPDRARARALRLPGPRLDEPPRLPAAVDTGDRARRIAPDAVLEHHVRADRVLDDPDRARHVLHQLRGRDREGAADRVRPPHRGGGDGPRRERVDDVPQGDAPADRARDPRGPAALLRDLDRRLRRHVLQRRQPGHVPDLRLGSGAGGDAAADQRHRHRHLRRRGHGDARQRHLPAPTGGSSMTEMAATLSAEELQRAAREHLWLHFTRMGGYARTEVPVIVRGEGCYLEDINGKRYLDALAGLFAVNIGYSYGEEIGQAALEQMRELPFYTNWSYAHPRAIELAAEVTSLAPGDLTRAFFVSGGSEAVESAWKLARQYHAARGERRWKAVAHRLAYHGTTLGALSINGIPALRTPFEPLVPDVIHVHNTNRYHRPVDESEEEFTHYLLDELEHTIETAGPETVCLVIMEPVQNAGGAFTPPAGYFAGVRELCDRYDILLCADEVITGFGRLGAWFGSEKYDIRPDVITIAKGLSSAYASIGGVVVTERVVEPFLEAGSMYTHGITFGGHPVQAAIALKNIEIMKRERIVEHVSEYQDDFRAT